MQKRAPTLANILVIHFDGHVGAALVRSEADDVPHADAADAHVGLFGQ